MRNFRLDDESGHQEALFNWAGYNMQRMPELEYLHHVPNGGKRDKATAIALKRQGVKAGVPDVVLPVPRGEYHGLYIELNDRKGDSSNVRYATIGFVAEYGTSSQAARPYMTTANAKAQDKVVAAQLEEWEKATNG